MTRAAYGIGDRVFLLNGPVRTGRPEGEFKIVACLPDINGVAQYRVRSEVETFERRIVVTDIDTERSKQPHGGKSPLAAVEAGGSWLKASAIKVGKSSV